MSPDHRNFSVGGDVLSGLFALPPQDDPYGQQSRRLRRIQLRLSGSLVAFFYDAVTQLGCHLLHITDMQRQFMCNLLIRYIQAHEIQTQYPYFQRLMMSRKNRVCQIVKPCLTVVTLIALTSWLCVIKATLDDLLRFARGARDAVWPALLADRLIALHIIDEMLNVDLHGWTPLRDRSMRGRQYTPSSHAATLESNMSEWKKRPKKPPRSKLRGITRNGIVCETPWFLTLFPLVHNALRADFST